MDLTRYLDRIGLIEQPAADPAGLALLQESHRRTIGFENFDIRLGKSIAIDSASVFDKLVRRGRGGYCFEQNRLYADALEALGIGTRPVLARVLLGLHEGGVPPKTHVALIANLNGEAWLVDAGFGGSYVPPLRLAHESSARTDDGAAHRLTEEPEGAWLLERRGPASSTDGRAGASPGWHGQYRFTLDPVAPVDLEMSNHWTSTRPGTRFTSVHVASIVLPGGFASLSDRRLTVHDRTRSEQRDIADVGEYGALLRDLFRLSITDEEIAKLSLFA